VTYIQNAHGRYVLDDLVRELHTTRRPLVPLSPAVRAALSVYDTASTWAFYNNFHLWVADGTFDLDGDTFKMGLYQSTSNFATASNAVLADLTNEVSNANGYTTGGVTLSGVTWTVATATATFTMSSPASWTASGGSIVCRAAVIYKSGTANGHANPLVCYSILDNTPADTTVVNGNTLQVAASGSGIFTLTG